MLRARASAVVRGVDAVSGEARVFGARHAVGAVGITQTADATQPGVAFQPARAVRRVRFEATLMGDAGVDRASDAVRAISVSAALQTAEREIAKAVFAARVDCCVRTSTLLTAIARAGHAIVTVAVVPTFDAAALPVTETGAARGVIGSRGAVPSEATLAGAGDPIRAFGVGATFDAAELGITAAGGTTRVVPRATATPFDAGIARAFQTVVAFNCRQTLDAAAERVTFPNHAGARPNIHRRAPAARKRYQQ